MHIKALSRVTHHASGIRRRYTFLTFCSFIHLLVVAKCVLRSFDTYDVDDLSEGESERDVEWFGCVQGRPDAWIVSL